MSMTAYDLSRFAAQYESEPHVRIRTAEKPARAAVRGIYRGRIIVCMTALFITMSLTVYNSMLLTEARAMSVSRTDELRRLESEYSYLNWQLEDMVSLKNAADYAENELGLVKISASQIEYINLYSSNEIIEDKTVGDAGGLFARIWTAFLTVFE